MEVEATEHVVMNSAIMELDTTEVLVLAITEAMASAADSSEDTMDSAVIALSVTIIMGVSEVGEEAEPFLLGVWR